MIRKIISFTLIISFVGSSLYIPQTQAGEMVDMRLPEPGVMVHLSPEYTPAHLQGLTIHPENALQFDFLIHRGDGRLDSDQKKKEYTKLIKYFLASLTIPDADQWVNLSPYEHQRIIKDDFGTTEMGRDLLSQDYLLKQITSSLMYPESGLGKEFWDKVYERAYKEFGTSDIPIDTFNKVWIVPDEAAVYESGNTVYVLRNHLKVMLEEDYLSLKKHSTVIPAKAGIQTHTIASKIVKSIILPELEKEVNEGKNFAMLRQIYSGMILATWYKHALKTSLLGQVYANKAKVSGVDQKDPQINEAIFQRYMKAFKKGVFNYIKEDADKYSQQMIPRKYFAGGMVDFASVVEEDAGATKGFSDKALVVFKEGAGIPLEMRKNIDLAAIVQSMKDTDQALVALSTNADLAADAAMLITVQQSERYFENHNIQGTQKAILERMVGTLNRSGIGSGIDVHAFVDLGWRISQTVPLIMKDQINSNQTPVDIVNELISDELFMESQGPSTYTADEMKNMEVLQQIFKTLPLDMSLDEFNELTGTFFRMIANAGLFNMLAPDPFEPVNTFEISIGGEHFQGEEEIKAVLSIFQEIIKYLGFIQENTKWNNGRFLLINDEKFEFMTFDQQQALRAIAEAYKSRALRISAMGDVYLQPDVQGIKEPRLSVKQWASRLQREMAKGAQGIEAILFGHEVRNLLTAPHEGGSDAAMNVQEVMEAWKHEMNSWIPVKDMVERVPIDFDHLNGLFFLASIEGINERTFWNRLKENGYVREWKPEQITRYNELKVHLRDMFSKQELSDEQYELMLTLLEPKEMRVIEFKNVNHFRWERLEITENPQHEGVYHFKFINSPLGMDPIEAGNIKVMDTATDWHSLVDLWLKSYFAKEGGKDKAMAAKTVLVIDDEELLRNVNAKILSKNGYHVLTASTPQEAKDVWAAHKDNIDLILSDTNRPGGLWTTEVSGFLSEKTVPVIAVSGLAKNAEIWKGITDHFLARPFTMASLIAKVLEVLPDQAMINPVGKTPRMEGLGSKSQEGKQQAEHIMPLEVPSHVDYGWLSENLSEDQVAVGSSVALLYNDPSTQRTKRLNPFTRQGIYAGWQDYLKELAHRASNLTKDQAMNGDLTKGGIDLNAANLNLQIKRDGKGVPLPLVQQDWSRLSEIQGFTPTIIEIKPAITLPILTELEQKLRSS